MFSVMSRGGPIMYPLLACSIVAVAIIFERAVFWLRIQHNSDRRLAFRILELAEKEIYGEAYSLGKNSKDYVVKMLINGIAHREYSLPRALEMAADEALKRMRRYLDVLDTIVTVAPLLGIFGTVLGIINSFDLLGLARIAQPQVVTKGIAQALITTAAGLAVAIVTLIAHNYFLSRIEGFSKEMELFASSLEIAFEKNQSRRQNCEAGGET
ncbi:MAG: MotA/TolQ/ExbB proton channel family protein [Deltaproteobacteria bacterium]|nr:MotA/TolQ/ExbB proton channel family protein [Deltaproteobacteria bacterium]MBW2120487.1 MotA/TolQ/ExbB proton channel family protein [Deltaproteobacteria bacterium]